MRLVWLPAVWMMAACGGKAAAPAVGAARFDGATPSPARAFQVSVPRPNGQTELFEVTARGEIYRWVTPYERPTEPAQVTLTPEWSLQDAAGDARLELRRHDGALVPTGYQPDMQCWAHASGEVRCLCDAHTPVVDITYSIDGADLVATGAGVSTAIGTVTPAPTTAAEKLRVLLLVAEWSYSLDDHSDAAHDLPSR